MRKVIVALAFFLGVSAGPAMAQSAAAAMKTFTSAADVQALIAKAKAERKGNASITVEPILALAPYHADLEYRPIAGAAAIHDTENEVMYVIEGAGTITLGGALVDPKRPNPTNQTSPSITGGTDRALAKGDFLIVPAGTPHQISAVTDALVLMTLHIPATPAAH